MKHSIFTLALIFGMNSLFAQTNVVSEYFSDYQEREDFIKISVTGKIFELMAHLETDTEEEEDFKEFVSSINSFTMVVGEEGVFEKKDYRSALKRVEGKYEELMSIEDKDGTFNFRIDEKNGVVREFIMVGIADDDIIIFSLTGDMDLAQLSRVGSKIQTEGFEYLEKLDDTALEELRVYPNPVEVNGDLNIRIPESFVGGTAIIYDIRGRQMMTYPMGLKKQRIELSNMPAGQYVIEFENNGISESRMLEVH